MHLFRVLALLAWASLLASGCSVRHVHLRARAGDCLNPPDRYCDEDGGNSILLQYHVYQLRTWVDVTTLDWEALISDGADIEALAGVLTDPEDPLMGKRRFTLQAGEEDVVEFRRKLRTSHLLVVAAGRDRTDGSMLVVPAPLLRREQVLCFEYYTVFQPPGRGQPCPFTFTATLPEVGQDRPRDSLREVLP